MTKQKVEKVKKKRLIPRLRFPEFKGEWEVKTLGEIAFFYKGKNISKSDIVDNGKTKCIRYGELYTKYNEVIDTVISKTNIDPANLFLSKKNDVIIPSSGETKEDIPKASCVLEKGIALGGDLNVIRSNENGIFLSYYLNGTLKNNISKIAQGDTVVHLYLSQLINLKISLPTYQEQSRIADCLTYLDEYIAAEAHTLTKLKAHKKALMQQLFPHEGERVPKLRFPGFKGGWEEKKLKLLAYRKTKRNIEYIKKVLTNSAGDGIVAQKIYFDRDIANQDNLHNYFVVDLGDYVYNPRISKLAPAGPISKNNIGQGVMSPLYTVFRFNNPDNNFYEHYFKTNCWHQYLFDISNKGARHDRMSLNINDFMDIPLPYPSEKEQSRIADCLSSIDDIITAKSKKIELLKTYKKGLMQQLFPAAPKL